MPVGEGDWKALPKEKQGLFGEYKNSKTVHKPSRAGAVTKHEESILIFSDCSGEAWRCPGGGWGGSMHVRHRKVEETKDL